MPLLGVVLAIAGLGVMVYGAVVVGRPVRCQKCRARLAAGSTRLSVYGGAFLCPGCEAIDRAYWRDLFADRSGQRVEKPRDSYTEGGFGGAAAS